MKHEMPQLKIGNLTARLPIIQGGMGVGISLAGLASAVSNHGGIGVISAVGIGLIGKEGTEYRKEDNIPALRREIRKARRLTGGILGINIMVALTDFDSLVITALEERIDVLFLGAGLPLHLPKGLSLEEAEKSSTKVFPIVSSIRATRLIFDFWKRKYHRVPDGVVVEGPEAGGHLGFNREQIHDPVYRLEEILPRVVKCVLPYQREFAKNIPVIAAGGIFTGADIKKFLDLGASGVQMGTRFVATRECDAHREFKKQFIKARRRDIAIIQSPVGLPGRAIINTFLRDVGKGKRKPPNCPWKCLKTCNGKTAPYCIARALTNARKGILEEGFAFSGSNGYLLKRISSVKRVLSKLKREFCAACVKGTKKKKTGLSLDGLHPKIPLTEN